MNNYSSKTTSRAYAFKYLYRLQWSEFDGVREKLLKDPVEFEKDLEEFDQSYIEQDKEHPENALTPNIRDYGISLISEVLENFTALEDKISPFLKRSFKSLEKVDATILLLALSEMQSDKEVPVKVVINEAIELAKKYGTKESSGFVNAVLDNISKNL